MPSCAIDAMPTSKPPRSAQASVGEATVENVRVRTGSVDVTLGIGASGRIHSATFHDRNAEGEVGTRTVVYSDFRAVEGMQLPYVVRATFNGAPEPQQSMTLDAIALNAAIDPALFAPNSAGEAMNLLAARAIMLLAALLPASDPASWPQWGGPSRNFVVESRALAASWPAEGPRRLWQRPLGEGYSAIVTDGRTVYTLYRDGTADVVIALNAASGATVWQTRYDAPFDETCSERLGPVPRAAPLLVGDRIITTSAGGLMNSFDRASGRLQWSANLVAAGSDAVRACGYSASPVAFEQLVIATAGGPGRGVVALKAESGEIAWKSQDFQNGYSSPLLIDLDGQPELVVFTYGEVSGLNPRTGNLEWSVAHASEQGVNVATPVWGAWTTCSLSRLPTTAGAGCCDCHGATAR